jgi:prepilin-type N-terminal cleavage/methylation domain-containing protein
MSHALRNAGFTLLEILFALVIVAGLAGLLVPRFKAGLEQRKEQRFLYSVATVSAECWRRAQLDCQAMHLVFDSLAARAWWEEGRIGVPYPTGFHSSRRMRWLFEPDAGPMNPRVLLCSSTDTIVVTCLLSERWKERRQ